LLSAASSDVDGAAAAATRRPENELIEGADAHRVVADQHHPGSIHGGDCGHHSDSGLTEAPVETLHGSHREIDAG
jgi:hypothetical protein